MYAHSSVSEFEIGDDPNIRASADRIHCHFGNLYLSLSPDEAIRFGMLLINKGYEGKNMQTPETPLTDEPEPATVQETQDETLHGLGDFDAGES